MGYASKDIRNILVAGHAGCGKTTLTEALLYMSGASERMGRVEDGTTASDFDPEEIRRKASLNSSVVPVEYEGHHLYAYVCRDKGMQEVERKKFLEKNANGRVNAKKFHEEMREHGVFVLLATRRIQAEHVLSHYYVRQDIEQVFDITKNYASLLPLNVEKEETFRGHLLMTFIATALLQRIQNELKNSNFSLDRILMRMRTQKAKVFENVVIPGEPVKEHRQIYKLLGVKCAKEYVRKAPMA